MDLAAERSGFFKTANDLELAVAHFKLRKSACEVVHYGAKLNLAKRMPLAESIRHRHPIDDKDAVFLFAGTLDYQPNADAVVAIYEKLIPLLNTFHRPYKIIVCGRNHHSKFNYLNTIQNERLVMVGEVSDIDAYFEAADVFINPMLTGGGVQTKNLDALSRGLNVVCFASKAAGIEEAGDKLFVAKDGNWEEFAAAVMKAAATNLRTPASFFETYDWRTIAARAYQKMLTA